MICRTAVTVGLAMVAWCLAGAERAGAQGFGVTTSPSTFLQCMGYGYGAGHHAPIVRSPWQEPAHTQRMAFAPRCYGTLEPSPYVLTRCTSGYAAGGCGCGYGCGPVSYGPPSPPSYGPPAAEATPIAPAPADEAAAVRDYRLANRNRWP